LNVITNNQFGQKTFAGIELRGRVDSSRTFRLAPEKFDEERSRLLRGLYAAYLAALVGVLLLALRGLDFSPGVPLLVTLIVITLSAIFTVSIGFWSIFRSLRIRQQAWVSFELSLADDRITRRLADHAELVLTRSEVTGFDETAGRGFFIKTADGHRFIHVPAGLEGYDELKKELSAWNRFPPARARDPIWRSPFFIGAACLVAWSVLWFSADVQYVLSSAFVLLVFLISTFIAVMRSPRSSATMKRTSWIYLAIAAVALIRVAQLFRTM
jgi:hypothetical protein